MEILDLISEALQKGKAKDVKVMVQEALDAGVSASDVLNQGLLAGMGIIGGKFKNNEVYVPDVLIAARAMKAGTEILKPLLASQGVKASGKVLIGTVKGDLHDIGKNLVAMMMEGKGLEVVDVGTDVPADKFISAAIENNVQVICCSALLTTTMNEMKAVVEAAVAAGVRSKFTIMVGGAPVNETFCKSIGADLYAPDAASAAEAAAAAIKARG
jgi:corrinoid protein of di/trimethylamine methyltransferase